MAAPLRRTLRQRLLRWYQSEGRRLPWRETRDPYAIWISEAMLQQTRVETVIPYYHRFLERFPDVQSLARAELDDVLRTWAGLGYYSRARKLRSAATQLVERFGGRLPEGVEQLRSLPGIGPYTAGAIASIAFDRPAPVVDGNVSRVLSRLFALRAPPATAAGRTRLWREAELLAQCPTPGDLNQALMELGATVCLPRQPRCSTCPIAALCRAREQGDPTAYPTPTPARPPQRRRGVAALLLRRGRALAVRRPEGGLLGGLWELPGGEFPVERSPRRCGPAAARALLEERVGLRPARLTRRGDFEYAFTHRLLALVVYRAEVPGGRVRLQGFTQHRWLAVHRFAELPMATVSRRALALALGE